MSTTIDPSAVKYVEIFPPIGIAAVGNSLETEGYFIGPEIPNRADVPSGGFKDAAGNIKRQAARFRAYAFGPQGQVLGELNKHTGYSLKWTVNVANSKAAGHKFRHKFEKESALRNPTVQGDLPVDQRTKLIISDSKAIKGVSKASEPLVGKFEGKMSKPEDVYLGELRTDDQGRLVFLGGRGRSYSPANDVHPPPMITSGFDMEDWIDDTCDGSVEVVATFAATGTIMPAPKHPAWVVCSPPKFSWGARAFSSLYDVIEELYEEPKRLREGYEVPDPVFYQDVWPLFEGTFVTSWLNASTNEGHGPTGKFNFLDREAELANPGEGSLNDRKTVFGFIRDPVIPPGGDPNTENYKARQKQTTVRFMPRLSGDSGPMDLGGERPELGENRPDPNTFASMTQLQHARLRKWALGKFTPGTKATPPTNLEQIPIAEQPKALAKAALEWTIGAALYPGIEMYWIAGLPHVYNLAPQLAPGLPLDPPFRINTTSIKPGDMTRGLSLPWQTDFFMCNTTWWPTTRPDDIVTAAQFQAVQSVTPNPSDIPGKLKVADQWARGFRANKDETPDSLEEFYGCYDMVVNWANLAFAAKVDYGDPLLDLPPIHVEGGNRGIITNPTPSPSA